MNACLCSLLVADDMLEISASFISCLFVILNFLL